VFLNAIEPSGAAPASLAYNLSTASLTSYSPLLNQTFFIGDGLTGTGSGSAQVFNVPTGATRLFFGFADSFNGSTMTGLPCYYGDNGGSLSVTIAAVPASACLCGAVALLFLAGISERRTDVPSTGEARGVI
jgi:hypothetical protein